MNVFARVYVRRAFDGIVFDKPVREVHPDLVDALRQAEEIEAGSLVHFAVELVEC